MTGCLEEDHPDVDQIVVHRMVMVEELQEEGEMEFLQMVVKVALEAEVADFYSLMLAESLLRETEKEFLEMVDDQWGETDVLMMLADSSEIETRDFSGKEGSTFVNRAEAIPEFGEYQPSILSGSGSRKSPIAGRRSSPEKCTIQKQPAQAPAVKTTYIKLKREIENLDKNVVPDMKLQKPPSVEEYTALREMQSTTKTNDDEKGLSPQRIESTCTLFDRDTSDGAQLSMDHLQTYDHHLFDAYRDHTNGQTSSQFANPKQFLATPRSLDQGPKSPPDNQRPRTPQKDDDELRREKALCDQLLGERNLLQAKLDAERESFGKEKETLQAKLAVERDAFRKDKETLLLRFEAEKEIFFKEHEAKYLKAKGLEDSLQRGFEQVLSAKEKIEKERGALLTEVKTLREENLMVKEEVLKVENERLAFEKQVSETEQAHEDTLLKKLEVELAEAQRIASQLSSEVQLLKSTSIMTQEKMTSIQKLHEQELQMLKAVHSQELQAKDKQLDVERKFLSDHTMTMDKLSQLFKKGDEWAIRVDVLQGALTVDRELSNNDRKKWLEVLDHTVTQSQAVVQKWENHCDGVRKQLDQLLAVLELGAKEVTTLRLDEKDRLDKEHAHLKSLQEAMHGERVQSLADLAAAREKLEAMNIKCVSKKEEFLHCCAEERKEIAAERDVVIHMREQLVHAEVAFEKQVMEHAIHMQSEIEESNKRRKELERAKEMATDLAEEVEEGRLELERQRHAFEQEIASVQALSAQAQQNVESAMEMKRAAAHLKLEAQALQQEIALQASEVENQRRQAAMAQNELIELKRRHDEERMRLAIERQQLCYKRDGSHVLGETMTSQSYVLPHHDKKSEVFNFPGWHCLPKERQGQQVSLMPTTTSMLSSTKSSFAQPPWIVENIEVSLCLQAQEDFLAEAKRALQYTTKSTSNLLTKSTD
ncbi:unnamed protein product [Calypogeia fissa]